MKLIYCKDCKDVVRLTRANRTCFCGAVAGYYKPDGKNAVISPEAVPLGIDNETLLWAIKHDGNQYMMDSPRFTAFKISEPCPTITRESCSDIFGKEAPTDGDGG